MYQVLYRKWRPRLFADVVGQPQVTVTLKNELQAGRVAHAYLFTGSRGTGKTTCAKILAKAVNCLHPVEGDPCGECEICRGIDENAVLDVVEIDAASNNGVENIRMLREEAAFTPATAKYRVYIIDEVHMLSTGAFNALLKTLEEPPAHVVFILATTEVHKLPATILSRCQRFDFNRISPEKIAERLTYVSIQEGAALEPEAALMISRLADGGMRDALSLLDQCMGRDKKITLEVVAETSGLAGREHLFELADAVLQQNASKALSIINRLHNSSKDMARLSEELTGHFRNLMLMNTMRDPQDLILLSEEEYKQIEKQAGQLSLSEVIHAIDTLQRAAERMHRGADRRTEMEMAMIKLCTPELDTTPESMLRRISQLERAFRAGGISQPSPHSSGQTDVLTETPLDIAAKVIKPIEQSSQSSFTTADSNTEVMPLPSPAVSNVSNIDQDTIQKNAQPMASWPEVLQILKGYSQVIASAFHGSSAYISGDFVLIDAPNSMAFELLRKSTQRDKMRVAIKEVTGRVYKLGPYKSSAPTNKGLDPLDELAERARDAGIEVTKK